MKRFAVLVLACGPAFVSASVTIGVYKPMRAANDPALQSYFGGALEAYGFANARLSWQGRQPLYCSPSFLALTPENGMHLVDRAIEGGVSGVAPVAPDMPVNMILLEMLVHEFPCPPSSGVPTKR